MTKEFWTKQLGEQWTKELAPYLKTNGTELITKLEEKYEKEAVCPKKKNVFRAFRETPYYEVRVVIIGQDPYFDGQATGIAFGNEFEDLIAPSASVFEIYKCIQKVFDVTIAPQDFDWSLQSWCKQGVLMLNSALTTKMFSAGAHKDMWQDFTKSVVASLNEKPRLAYLLLGSQAKAFSKYINMDNHLVVSWEHPAAACREKRGWVCPHFLTINEYLEFCKTSPIKWH